MSGDNRDAFGALVRKLNELATLNDADKEAIAALPFRVTTASSGAHLVREGDKIVECCLLLSGFAFRYKLSANGNRQIVSFHLPADILDLQHLLLPTADHGVQTLGEAKVAWIPVAALKTLIEQRPAIGEAMWRDTLIDASIFREWVLNVGQRDARSRIAHMLCEFALRRQAAGLGTPERFELPMTQEHIADATGLTAVHVNRMLMSLTNDGIIERDKREIRIADWDRMRRAADFQPGYLHMAA
ncbi:Crp/Fnr family transcriptional regulator [Sphingomonas sp.]|jgi:CRP-like cAMP-binding protein|uniref:Crp/Fnr family transcriptional regulator n=1 Tax=Sphingomonas sp. TaxID=28214 RepID=UPI002EDB74D6